MVSGLKHTSSAIAQRVRVANSMQKQFVISALCLSLWSGVCLSEPETPADASLDDVTAGLLVADPKSIIKARKEITESSAARRAPIVDTFDTFAESNLDLEETFNVTSEPDSRTPLLFIAKGMSTSVNFVDAYGKPWPIRRAISFLEGQIGLIRVAEPVMQPPKPGEKEGEAVSGIDPMDPQAGSLNLTALKSGANGNITVYLVGRSSPVTLSLEAKSGVYHKEATIKISEVGPQTDLKKINRGDEVVIGTRTDADLNNVLYGIGPVGSQKMMAEGGEANAWVKGNFLYLQTPLSVFSPKVLGTTHANGKYRAYKLPASTMVMGSNEEGRTVTLKIKRISESDVFAESQKGNGR